MSRHGNIWHFAIASSVTAGWGKVDGPYNSRLILGSQTGLFSFGPMNWSGPVLRPRKGCALGPGVPGPLGKKTKRSLAIQAIAHPWRASAPPLPRAPGQISGRQGDWDGFTWNPTTKTPNMEAETKKHQAMCRGNSYFAMLACRVPALFSVFRAQCARLGARGRE